LSRVFLFALTAALNPSLLTATTVMLLLPNPKRLMLGYLAGAYTTSVIVGVAVVEWLHNSGVIALIAAVVVGSGSLARRRERRKLKRGDEHKKPPRWQRALSGGSPKWAFLVGVLLSFPGASYLAALIEIRKQNLGFAGDLLLVIVVTVIQFALLEVPLIGFALAPERTTTAIDRFKRWMARNGAEAIAIGLAVIGAALILLGALTLVA